MWRAEGFNDCIIGTVTIPGESRARIAYDEGKCIQKIMLSSDGQWSYDDAEEYFGNYLAGPVIDSGPVYIALRTLEEIEEMDANDDEPTRQGDPIEPGDSILN